jgi:hypothetical protein
VIFNPIPTAAAAQINIKNGMPTLYGRANKHTGVYVPAINTKTMAWSICCIVFCERIDLVNRWYEAEVEYNASSDNA